MANPYQHGEELKPLQERLKAAGIYHGAIDGIFGEGTGKACQVAKYRLGYPSRAVEETGGQRLLDFLRGAKPLPPTYKLRRRQRGYADQSAEDALRQRIVDNAKWGVANTAAIHYQQSRPIDGHRRLRKLPLYTDCSGFVTDCYEWAGAKVDPNGLGFDGFGWTGTMLAHGQTIPLFEAKPADLVIWGTYPGHHVAVIVDVTDKANPLIVSHGSESEPGELRLSQETAAQRRSFVIKRYI